MKVERVAPVREEDVQVTMTAQEARYLYIFLRSPQYRNAAANQLLEALGTIGCSA